MTPLEAARRVADAVLYEGYLLYPYRASSSKNQVRWQFGVLGPRGAVDEMVGEDSRIYTETVLQPLTDAATVDVLVRFLQTQWRAPERPQGDGRFEHVDELRVGGTDWIAWHEAVEREVEITGLTVDDLLSGRDVELSIPGGEDPEILYASDGTVAGRLLRTRYPLRGRMRISAVRADTTPPALSIRVEVVNLADLSPSDEVSRSTRRDLAARQSFVGTHLLLRATDATFVSVVDPPSWARAVAGRCTNARCWPVLAGTRGDHEQTSEIVFGTPIILGDFPEIAEESPGQLFDSAEIDEILTLRIMTMTDEEKAAARGTDPRAAAIIERSDAMPQAVFERLHGALRAGDWTPDRTEPDFPTWFNEQAEATVAPETDVVRVAGVPVSKDSRVLLRPKPGADAHDMFLAGKVAIVRRIDLDVDGNTHVAVLLEEDPAADLHDWHGRYYYFGPDEIEPLVPDACRASR